MRGFRYAVLRMGLCLTQQELADRLGVSLSTIKRREKSPEVSKEAAYAIAALRQGLSLPE